MKLVTLNTYMDQLHDITSSYILSNQADVMLLQEVRRSEMISYALRLDMYACFAPMTNILHETPEQVGVAILSKQPLSSVDRHYYTEFRDEKDFDHYQGVQNVPHCVLLVARTEIDGQPFMLGCTHFTRTDGGEATLIQQRGMERLIVSLLRFPEIIFGGDFNAPRGRETYTMLAERYLDHVPEHVTSTLDPEHHKAGHLQYVVDSIFSTPHYQVSNAYVRDGVSDHQAVEATVLRTD